MYYLAAAVRESEAEIRPVGATFNAEFADAFALKAAVALGAFFAVLTEFSPFFHKGAVLGLVVRHIFVVVTMGYFSRKALGVGNNLREGFSPPEIRVSDEVNLCVDFVKERRVALLSHRVYSKVGGDFVLFSGIDHRADSGFFVRLAEFGFMAKEIAAANAARNEARGKEDSLFFERGDFGGRSGHLAFGLIENECDPVNGGKSLRAAGGGDGAVPAADYDDVSGNLLLKSFPLSLVSLEEGEGGLVFAEGKFKWLLASRSEGKDDLFKALFTKLLYRGDFLAELHIYSKRLYQRHVPLHVRVGDAEIGNIFRDRAAGAPLLIENSDVRPLPRKEAGGGKSGRTAAHDGYRLAGSRFELRFVEQVETGVFRRLEIFGIDTKRALVKSS